MDCLFSAFCTGQLNAGNSFRRKQRYNTERLMLSCEQYDYIEIACMHRYPVLLTLKTGQEISSGYGAQ